MCADCGCSITGTTLGDGGHHHHDHEERKQNAATEEHVAKEARHPNTGLLGDFFTTLCCGALL